MNNTGISDAAHSTTSVQQNDSKDDSNTSENTSTATTANQKGFAHVKEQYLVQQQQTKKRTADEAVKDSQDGGDNARNGNKRRRKGQNKHRRNRMSLGVSSRDEESGDAESSGYMPAMSGQSNIASRELQIKLRKSEYDYTWAHRVSDKFRNQQQKQKVDREKEQRNLIAMLNSNIMASEDAKEEKADPALQGLVESDASQKRHAREVKRVDLNGKLIVAPLTTVGNLPFRRCMKKYGADITIGEMALTYEILKGNRRELSLLRRHESEDVFGVQLAGNDIRQMCEVAQLLEEEFNVDFVDINCGCPIDLLCKRGMGAGLMERKQRLSNIVTSMKEILSVPVTVKMRTGIKSNKPTAHQMFQLLDESGVDALTLHGRSKEQRYTKLANWDYIEQCAKLVKCPVIGNGDVMDFEEYNAHAGKVDSIMIGRGALIKPWIFTEIKEQRHWDISSTERFDNLREFVKHGLDHYGSDELGIENTRRFTLEWMSFLHRYIPVGLLERVPQKINERPPHFVGRNELETLMASGDVRDWIKLTTMIPELGTPHSGFTFVPKHKSNSYEGVEG